MFLHCLLGNVWKLASRQRVHVFFKFAALHSIHLIGSHVVPFQKVPFLPEVLFEEVLLPDEVSILQYLAVYRELRKSPPIAIPRNRASVIVCADRV